MDKERKGILGTENYFCKGKKPRESNICSSSEHEAMCKAKDVGLFPIGDGEP